MCYLASAWTIPQASSQRTCATIFDIRHIPQHWAHSHHVPTVRLRGKHPAIFFNQDYQKKTGQTIHTRQSLFPPLLFLLRTAPLCISWGAENVVRLRLACWPTWVLPVDRAKATVPARTRKLCGGIPRLAANRKVHFFFLFFFSVIGENQCGRITRNTEKNLHGLTWTSDHNWSAAWSERAIASARQWVGSMSMVYVQVSVDLTPTSRVSSESVVEWSTVPPFPDQHSNLSFGKSKINVSVVYGENECQEILLWESQNLFHNLLPP